MNTSLRVLHVCPGLGPLHGGPGIDLPNYCRALARAGCEVTLATGYSSSADHPSAILDSLSKVDRLRVRAFPCVFAHRYRLSPGLGLWLARNAGRFDIVHLHSLYLFPVLMGHAAAGLRKVPYVLTTHATLAPFQRTVSARKKAVYDLLFARRTLDNASALIFSAYREYEEALPVAHRAPGVIIPNGIALDQFDHMPPRGIFRAKFLDGSGDPLLLYLGRLNAKKIEVLIPAFAEVVKHHPRVRMALVGFADPPQYLDEVRRLISEFQLSPRVVMPGMLSGTDKLAALADADLFVLPSRTENFASAMFEAMACRLPVVVSSGIATAPEVASYGAGIVVEREPLQLSRAVLALLENPARRREMGVKARVLAEKYTPERTATHLIALYRHILDGDPPQQWAVNGRIPVGTLPSAAAILNDSPGTD